MASGSISGLTEGILLSLAFVVIFTIVVGNFNIMYGENHNVGLTDNSTEAAFIQYSANSQNLSGGEVVFSSAVGGVTLKSSYGILKDALDITWSFISGGWIENTVNMIGLGESGIAIARTLRILYFLSLIFALLYALFKVVI